MHKNKISFILIFFCTIFLLFCKNNSANDNSNSSLNQNELQMRIQRQSELVEIFERNSDNPSNALKALDIFYKKYSEKLKNEILEAKKSLNQNEMNMNYLENPAVVALVERQKNAFNKLLAIDPQFNVKMMILMKKYGLAEN